MSQNLIDLIKEAMAEYKQTGAGQPTHLVLSNDFYESLSGAINSLAAKFFSLSQDPDFNPELKKDIRYDGPRDLIEFWGMKVLVARVPLVIVCCSLPEVKS